MSDTLQLVVVSPNTQANSKQLRRSTPIGVSPEVACWVRLRQAEAYRTFACRVSLSLSVAPDYDKLKHIGHLVVAFL
jgi:hypothetical protein